MLAYGFVDVYMGNVMLLPAHAGMEKHFIPGSHFKRIVEQVQGTARPPPSFVPIIACARRKHAQTRRKGGRGAEPEQERRDKTTRQRGARRPRPELQLM